jgi:hypothetical protein
MRLACWCLLGILGWSGCARRSSGDSGDWPQNLPAGTSSKAPPVIVTPTHSRLGRISSVNSSARYVVITYPVGVPLPAVQQRLNVYRAGLKVGEVKVSKEQVDVNTVADIVAGEGKVGDEVRED